VRPVTAASTSAALLAVAATATAAAGLLRPSRTRDRLLFTAGAAATAAVLTAVPQAGRSRQ
jgi:hypothetical protein